MCIIRTSIMLVMLLAFSTVCFAEEVTKLQNLKGDTVLTPLKDSRTNLCVTDTSVFGCDFSSSCPLGGTSDSQWYQIDGYPDYQLWTSSVGTATSNTPPSLAVQLGGDVPFGLLLSDPITCAASGSSLNFKFWANKNVMLKVCLISKSSSQELLCTDQLNQQSPSYPGSFTLTTTKAINEPFIIQFMASSEPGVEGILVLDDVYYYGNLCDSPPSCDGGGVVTQNPPITDFTNAQPTTEVATPATTTQRVLTQTPSTNAAITSKSSTKLVITTKFVTSPSTTASTTPSTKKPAQQTNICQAVPCNFEANWCKFSNFSDSTVNFQRRNSPYGPPLYRLFDIKMSPTTGYYISAMINGKTDVAILSSSQFEPSNNKQLSFKFYRAVDGHTIKVCFDTNSWKFTDKNSMKQCTNAIPKLTGANAFNWNTATVPISNTATKFYFVATNDGSSGGSGPVAIDDVSIVGC